MAAVKVVGAVGADQGDRGVEAAREQEAHQVAGRHVGPVEVLDDEEDGLVGADELGEGVHALEQRSLVGGHRLGSVAWLSIRWPGRSRREPGGAR